MGFVDDYIKFYSSYESPTSFWKWSAYAAIAGTLRSKVYFEYGAGRIYPNIYVILLADSAEYRKGAPIKAVKRLLTTIKATKIYTGTASIQGVLDELSLDVADKTTGIPIKGGSCLIGAEELASFFVADPRLIPMLTDIWEYYEEYPYKLKSGTVVIKDLCTTLLAASNETFLREVYDARAVYGGLLGRTFIIKPDETRKPNSLMYDDLTAFDNKHLIDFLKKVKELKGTVRRTDHAAKVYDDWYKDLYTKYKTHPDKTGVMQRMHTNVFKLAIILCAASLTLEITADIFETAIMEVTSLKGNYESYAISSGKSTTAIVGSKFLDELYENGIVKRSDFLMKYWMEMDMIEFDDLIGKLSQAGMIGVTGINNEIAYKMEEKGRAVYGRSKVKQS